MASPPVSEPVDDAEARSARPWLKAWRRLPRAWQIAALAAAGVSTWLVLRFLLGYPPGAFPWAGTDFTGPNAPHELVTNQGSGYDGQFVYRLTIDPFTTQVTGHGITFDRPAYRQQRIMTALLAHVAHWVPGISPAIALIIVNGLAIVVAVVAGMALAAQIGRGARAGLLLALPGCLPVSLSADLTEPVAWAAVLCGVLAVRRGRWMWAAIAFTVAVLARETTGLFVAGYLFATLLALRREPGRVLRPRLALLLPVAVETAWQIRLWAVWGNLPVLSGFSNTVAESTGGQRPDVRAAGASHTFPLLGIARTFLNGFVRGDDRYPVIGLTYVIERCVLVLLIGAAGWLLASRRVRIGASLTVAWILAALIPLSMSGWVDDIQFLRPSMEVWGLSVFVLLHTRYRWSRWLLMSVVGVVAWSSVYALIRH